MRKFGINFQRIDHVFISHLHGDHFFGLVGLLSTMHLMGRVKPIHIYGPAGLKEIILLQIEYAKGKLAFELHFTEIPSGTAEVLFEDAKVTVSCFPLKHKIPTSGFIVREKPRERKLLADKCNDDGIKIEYYHKLKRGLSVTDEAGNLIDFREYTEPAIAPRAYAYCSDTAFSEVTINAVRNVNYLYHEATFIELLRDRAKATKHSTAKDAAQVAKLAGVGHLLLGHLSARYDTGELHIAEAAEIFENVRCAEDGDVIEIV